MEKVEPSVPDADVTADVVIKADSPIRAKEGDLLGRDRMAASVAGMINSSLGHETAGDESLVVGIEGEWGYGKTSFINLILENLKSFEQRDYLIIEFNPWNFSDQNELITDFFESIIDALESEKTLGEKPFEIETAVRRIRRYFPKLLERGNVKFGIPGVLDLGLDLKGMTGDPLERQKKEINGLLAEIGKPMVIVIDDIDRLDSQETKLVFKLVRMTANFANTVFILAYDRGKVGKRITEKGIEGEEFLKKIVQLSFPLPRVDQRDLSWIFFREFTEIIREFDDENWNWSRWQSFFDSCLKKFFRTVRDIRRYVNGLRLDLKIMPTEEVNPIDFLAIEAIRIFAPDVYFAMANEKFTFVFLAPYRENLSEGFSERSEQEEKTRREACEHVIGKAPEDLTETVRETVKWLFPQVADLYPDGQSSRKYDRATWRKQLMVCSEDIFDKYFSLSVTSLTLSEKSLKDFLLTLDDIPMSTRKLRKFEEEGKSGLVIERLSDHLDDLNDRQRENLIVLVLEDFTENITDEGPLFFNSGIWASRANHLCYEILKRMPSQEKLELAARVIESSRGVFSPAYLLGSFYQHLKDVEEGKSQESPLFTKKDMRYLNGICIRKIEEAEKDGSLSDSEGLHYVLSYWKERGTAAEDYVAGLLKTEDGLFRFLTAFVCKERSHPPEDHSVRITEMIDRNAIGEFTDLGELDRLVDDLDPGSLTEEQADVIELYRNPAPHFPR